MSEPIDDEPTCQLRWLLKDGDYVLQQWWRTDGPLRGLGGEWRDVPIVKEETN